MSATISFTPIKTVVKKAKGIDRLSVHRHADETIKKLLEAEAVNAHNAKIKNIGTGVFFKYCKLLAKGIEYMFSPLLK